MVSSSLVPAAAQGKEFFHRRHRRLLFLNFSNMSLTGNSSLQIAPVWIILPQGAVLQAQAVPVWVPHGATSPARKPAPVWVSLLTHLHLPARTLLENGLPKGS